MHDLWAMKNKLTAYALPVLAGVLLSWAFPRFHVHWLAWVALVPLVLSAGRAAPLQAGCRFFLAGWVFHSILLQWLCANIFWAGGWAVIGQQLLCVLLALHWAAVGAGWRWLVRRWPGLPAPLVLAACWYAMEFLMARWFSGFGWGALGYSQGPLPSLARWAAPGGVEFVSAVLVLFNAALAGVLAGPKRPAHAALAVAVLLVALFGLNLAPAGKAAEAGEPFNALLVQPAFSQEIKWDPDFFEFMGKTLDQNTRAAAKKGPVSLMVWPEAAVPGDLAMDSTLEPLWRLTAETGAPLFTGITRDDPATGKSYNSTALITPDGAVAAVYDKVHLAPFGEYVPFGTILPFLESIAFGGCDPGDTQKVIPVGNRTLGPLICFEVLFSPMARELKRMGADCLVVVTNLAWFGASNAQLQELEIARFRAIETGLPLVHCANTGISGVFDCYGNFLSVSMRIGADGRVMQYDQSRIIPAMLQGQRMAGVIAVSPPAASLPTLWLLGVWLIPLAVFMTASNIRFKTNKDT